MMKSRAVYSGRQHRRIVLGWVVICCSLVWILDMMFIFHSQHVMMDRRDDATDRRYIIFDARRLAAQGAGNLMHGLLAAHVLGYEYNRIVCVDYPSFWVFFDYAASSATRDLCEHVARHQKRQTPVFVRVVNYEALLDECRVHNLLRSDMSILHFVGNSYPGAWPSRLPNEVLFWRYYRPRRRYYQPYAAAAGVVVHLRVPDGPDDARLGLDEETLTVLGETLPNTATTTFLVTNHVALYQRFAECCGWFHPSWKHIKHSALPVEWKGSAPAFDVADDEKQQTIQSWTDWYTILTASDKVYHTISDFSSSAVHWSQNNRSHVIRGSSVEGRLVTVPEAWCSGNTEVLLLSERFGVKECATIEHNSQSSNKHLLEGLEFSSKRDQLPRWFFSRGEDHN